LTILVAGAVIVAGDIRAVQSQQVPHHTDILISIAALIVLGVSYALNRLGWLRPAAIIALTVMTISIFAAAIPSPSVDDVGILYFIVIPVVFSSLLMPLTYTFVMIGLVTAGMILFDYLVPGLDSSDVPVISTLLISGLVLLSVHHRRLLESDKQADLSESEERFRTIVSHAPEAILLLKRNGVVAEANDHARRLLDAPKMVGNSIGEVLGNGGNEGAARLLTSRLVEANGSGPIRFDLKWLRDGGDPVVCETQLVKLPGSRSDLVRASLIDVTERRNAEEKLRHLATHDPLTDLPNRALFSDRLDAAAARADRSGTKFAVLFLDLDNFKRVNDAFGHRHGDELLKRIATRLTTGLRGTDTVARFGGDEFAVLVEGLDNPISVVPVLEKVINQVAQPMVLRTSKVGVTTSIGVSIYPDNGDGADELLQASDTALYAAKLAGKNAYAFYDARMAESTVERLALTADLRRALAEEQFLVQYQPQVDLESGRVVGFEALVRWNHPDRGILMPDQFLGIAEEGGMIAAIGDWVLHRACRQVRAWADEGFDGVRVSVNLSAGQVRDRQIITTVRSALEENDLAPQQLELELTENILFQETEGAAALLRRIKDLGIRLAVDDFGSGYSTLRQIASFPIDVIKIDKLFASGVLTDTRDAAVVEGLARIAQNLGLSTIGEGIEDTDQLEMYRRFGFDMIQGFVYSPPVDPQTCTDLLACPSWL
jgi:diguanylate cyclase (GGDEF)-like protein/PAS domain S-box-containing protein